ncbi:hypothetical protein [Virgibacillus kimchii]
MLVRDLINPISEERRRILLGSAFIKPDEMSQRMMLIFFHSFTHLAYQATNDADFLPFIHSSSLSGNE